MPSMVYVPKKRTAEEVTSHWGGDKFGRVQLALDIESFIIDRNQRPTLDEGALTIAIDGDYGAGKSFFLRNLHKQLSDQFPVALVDAWADDSGDDPLLTLMIAIQEAISVRIPLEAARSKSAKAILPKMKALGGVVAKAVLRGGLKFLVTEKGVTEFEEVLKQGLDDSLDAMTDSNQRINSASLLSRRQQIKEFRDHLNDLMHEVRIHAGVGTPLIIIVDELDRCRPTYALRLLEESKHFFDHTDTVFIFGINVGQLVHTVKAVYGESYKANHYLARFLKTSLNLDVPEAKAFTLDLMERDPKACSEWVLISSPQVNSSSENIAEWLSALFRNRKLTIRDIERVMDMLMVATRLRTERYPVQIAALAPHAVDVYLARTDRSTDVPQRYQIPSLPGHPDSEALFNELRSAKNVTAVNLDQRASYRPTQQFIASYARDYVAKMHGGTYSQEKPVSLPHRGYARLLQRVGPLSYGDED